MHSGFGVVDDRASNAIDRLHAASERASEQADNSRVWLEDAKSPHIGLE